jgi:very-short-patch-repair endonuclease
MKYRDDPAAYHKEYYEKNKDKLKKNSKSYYDLHKEEILAKERLERQKAREERPPKVPKICNVEGCENVVHGRGWCNKHWQRWKNTGDPLGSLPPNNPARYLTGKPLSAAHKGKLSVASKRSHTPEMTARITDPFVQQRAHETLKLVRKTEASRQKTAQRSREQWAAMDEETRQKRVKPMLTANPSSLERTVAVLLETLGIVYEAQKRIGRYYADFYVPSKQLVIECDGEYWHSQQVAHDAKRDAFMRSQGYTVLRLSEQSIRTGTYVERLKVVV